jgi:hypothetical protein
MHIEASELDTTIAALLRFRDRPGTGPDQRGAHGTGFDRVNAFQLGVEQGANRCVAFKDEPPVLTAQQFRSVEELMTGGNLDYPSTLRIVPPALNRYFVSLGPAFVGVSDTMAGTASGVASGTTECPGPVLTPVARACPTADGRSGPALLFDDGALRSTHARTGDFAVAVLLAQAWATFELDRAPAGLTSKFGERALTADCLTGSWIASTADGELSLSPGDIDEGITALVLAPDTKSPFELARALRAGFFGGAGACVSGL